MPESMRVQRVLVAIYGALIEHRLVRAHSHRHGLMTQRPCRVLCREEFADEARSFDNWCTKNAEAYVNPSNNWYTQRCRKKAVGNNAGVAKLKEFCSDA